MLRDAKAVIGNLSATVDQQLTVFVQHERARRRDAYEALGGVISALSTYHAEHGYLSDDIPSF